MTTRTTDIRRRLGRAALLLASGFILAAGCDPLIEEGEGDGMVGVPGDPEAEVPRALDRGEVEVEIGSATARLADAELTAQWWDAPIPPNCMGLEDDGSFRTYNRDDITANPQEGELCDPTEGTAPGGHCNVPCGYETVGNRAVGNKSCECSGGFFLDCRCKPLPSVQVQMELANSLKGNQVLVGSCEDDPAAPTPEEWDETDDNQFVDNMDGRPCDEPYKGCMAPDLPPIDENGVCGFTTNRGCLCLPTDLDDPDSPALWQCGSTNSWFVCDHPNCPSTYLPAGVGTNGRFGESVHCAG